MIYEVYVRVEDEEQINFHAPQLNVDLTFSGILAIDMKTRRVLAAGLREEEVKKRVLAETLQMTDKELRKLGNRYSEEELDHFREFREVCLLDKSEGTFCFWEISGKDIRFVNPFEGTQFDPELVVLYLKHLAEQIYSDLKTGLLGYVSTLWDKCNYHIELPGYENMPRSVRWQFEHLLVRSGKTGILPVNRILINERVLHHPGWFEKYMAKDNRT